VYKTHNVVGDFTKLIPELTLTLAQRPRALRMRFVATIVITDVVSERRISSRTDDLSVHGCFVPTPTPFDPGMKVQVNIVYAGAKVMAFGRVVSARTNGMGITFTGMEQRDQAILERWMNDLRKK
jgi:hypothetical protein